MEFIFLFLIIFYIIYIILKNMKIIKTCKECNFLIKNNYCKLYKKNINNVNELNCLKE